MALQRDVCIGQIWTARVSGRIVQVQILSEKEGRQATAWTNKGRDRFICKNLQTGRTVEMTAGKFRNLIEHSKTDAPADVEKAALDILNRAANGG